MKKCYLYFVAMVFLASCQDATVEKPENLIPEDKMVDIIYDLSVLQAMRSANQGVLDSNKINPSTYVYKKYKIDSIQFAKSNEFYAASNIKKYEKLYQQVNDRLMKEKTVADTLLKRENDKLKKNSVGAVKSDAIK